MIERNTYRSLISLLFMIAGIPLLAQISPGKLSEPHAHLEGLSNCTECHVLGQKVSDEKCLDCHQVIAIRIRDQRGYHASAEVRTNSCVKCHSEHHGRNFQMIHFDPDTFDHRLTGYELQGSHTALICGDCHKSEFISVPQIKAKSSTYLGLEQNCTSCHTDNHQGTLSPDCASCHDYKKFKPASKFDHCKTRFKLRGQHASVACEECHKVLVQNGTDMQQFAGVAFGNCTSCHKDVHDDKFGQNCTQCHSEQSFTQIKEMKNFNHTLTDYPLIGKHEFVACNSCHKNQYTEAIEHSHCSDCHSDYHDNEFVHQGPSPDCSHCHSTQGFDQSDFTIDRHNKTEFELTGAHLATPCFACHKTTKRWNFSGMGKTCSECHEDIHIPYLDREYYQKGGCESCHSSNSWGEIDFDHSKTSFKLEGVHRQQSCRSCHFRADSGGTVHQEFSQLSSTCVTCHQDVHNSQFEEMGGSNCQKCHGFDDWSASRFDHDQTAFKLEGKHRAVACIKCHAPVVSGQITFTEYKIKDFSCESCH